MNPAVSWRESNDSYLSAALHWLRLRLHQATDPQAVTPEALQQARTALTEAESRESPPALAILGELFGLSPLEQELLLLCAALALDPSLADLYAQVFPHRPYATFTLAFSIFEEATWEILSPESPLHSWRLLEIHPSGIDPATISPLTADDRIINFLKGLNSLDDRLSRLLVPLASQAGGSSLSPSQQQIAVEVVRHLQVGMPSQSIPIIQLLGVDAASKQAIARYAAGQFNLPFYRLLGELLPTHATELDTLIRLWEREARLLPLALYLDGTGLEGMSPTADAVVALRQFLSRRCIPTFLDSHRTSLPLDEPTVTLEVGKPTPLEQRGSWHELLGEQAGEIPSLLSSQFNLNLQEIEQIAAKVLAETPSNFRPKQLAPASSHSRLHQQLWAACLARTRPRLDALAQTLDTKATWDDLVLPEEPLNLLRQISAQVQQRSRVYDDWGFRERMNRGLGVSALFAGESGTGKTMAAEVIANALNLHLYRIDLSSVVSKYIGETEKNLRRLFDAAEEGGAILFFDEADALFGKRSDVKDSHDRYANIEINYLLQRIEAYRGLAILATNLKGSLDSAFLRRLRFIVNFPFPSLEYRRKLWQKVFPSKTPLEALDYDHLAQLNLTGGSIHNIALNAAFVAAQQGEKVKMKQILTAARTEFRKLERPVYEADFQWQASELVERES